MHPPPTTAPPRPWRSGSSRAATAASSPCSTARTSCWPLAGEIQIAYFPEATRAVVEGPYDLSLVEGSITTAEDAARIQEVRRMSRRLVTIGACATSGGIQALRNFADVEEFSSVVYAQPVVHRDPGHLDPDRGPRRRRLPAARLPDRPGPAARGAHRVPAEPRRPRIPAYSVCVECKRRGNVCVTVAHGTPCLGPVTHAGCGALCPTYARGCYGCFGPAKGTPNTRVDGRPAAVLGMSGARRQPGVPDVQRGAPSRSAARARPSRDPDEAEAMT